MIVTLEQVMEIAVLARLRLTEEEARIFTAQLAGILEHVAELESADAAAAGLPADFEPARLRQDAPPPDPLVLPPRSIAPEWGDGFFAVPRLAGMDGGVTEPDVEL